MEKLKRFYLRYEKAIVPVGLFVVLASAFYYIDWHCVSRNLAGRKFYSLHTFVDDLPPFQFSPGWIWIYLSYYFLVFAPIFVIHNISTFRRVSLAFFLEYAIAFVIFLVFPVKMDRPVPGVDFALGSLSTRAVAWFYGSVDPGYNVFPSMHVANMLLVAFLIHRFHRKLGIAMYGITTLITISTLTVKQHYFLDLPAGVLVAIAAYQLAMINAAPGRSSSRASTSG